MARVLGWKPVYLKCVCVNSLYTVILILWTALLCKRVRVVSRGGQGVEEGSCRVGRAVLRLQGGLVTP